MIVAMLAGFLALIASGIAIVASLTAVSVLGVALIGDIPAVIVAQRIVSQVESPFLVAIPLFLLMGSIMNEGGVSRRIFDLASALVGHWRGGLAQVNVVASIMLGGLSGSSTADAALTSKVLVPTMVARGYTAPFAGAVTAASATVAPIIPPSIIMVIYAALTGVSIGRLFIAGIMPGIGAGCLLLLLVYAVSLRRGYRSSTGRLPAGEVLKRLGSASLALALPVIIIGGIRFGIFTATEAAAAGSVYAFFLGSVVYRELSPEKLSRALVQTATDTGIVMLLVGVAAPLTWYLGVQRIPATVGAYLADITQPLVFMLALIAVLLVLGSTIESTALLILVAPIVAPMGAQVGVDPIALGVVVILTVTIATVTPPVGHLVYTVSAISRIPAENVFREIFLLLPALLAVLLVVAIAPESYLWLVELIGP